MSNQNSYSVGGGLSSPGPAINVQPTGAPAEPATAVVTITAAGACTVYPAYITP